MFESIDFFHSQCNDIRALTGAYDIMEMAHWITNFLSDPYVQKIDYLGDKKYQTTEELKSGVLSVYKSFGVYNKSFCSGMIMVTLPEGVKQPEKTPPSIFLLHENALTVQQTEAIRFYLGAELLLVGTNIKQLVWLNRNIKEKQYDENKSREEQFAGGVQRS